MIDADPPRIENQQFCQSTPDPHFVDPQGRLGNRHGSFFSAGMISMQPHYLRAKHGVFISYLKNGCACFAEIGIDLTSYPLKHHGFH